MKMAYWMCCGLLGCLLASSAHAAPCGALPGDGRLVLYSYPHKEVLDVKIAPDTTKKIAHLLRSDDEQEHAMNPALINLLDHLQDHFGADTIEIISGYRSPAFNQHLKNTGHAVARESEHIRGNAADVHIDEITETALRDYAQSLHCGGVGFYPSLNFVHVDFGPERQWHEAAGARKLVGELPITITTSANIYFSGDRITFTALSQTMQLQHFHRGVWQDLQTLAPHTTALQLATKKFPFGKYRLRREDGVGFSNEFYVKR